MRTAYVLRALLPALLACGVEAPARAAECAAPVTVRMTLTADSAATVVERQLQVGAKVVTTREVHLAEAMQRARSALDVHRVELSCAAHALERQARAEAERGDDADWLAGTPAPPAPPAPPTPATPATPFARRAPGARIVRVYRGVPAPRGDEHAVITDTMLAAPAGVTLSLETLLGDVSVNGWTRNAVRVRAEHDARVRVVAEPRGRELVLDVDSPVGPTPVDWNIWVPVSMPVQVSAIEGDIRVDGTNASVEAQSVKGDVHVSGGNGVLDVSSIEGEVHVAGARGTVRAGSVNNGLRLVRLQGDVEAQTVNGDIQLSELDAANVDASTVNGSVWYGGPFRDRGHYRFSSHNGMLVVGVPEDASLDLKVQSFNGGFRPALPVRLPPLQRGKRFEFQLGGGATTLDLESFNGLIRLVRMEELAKLRALAPAPPAREKETDR